MSDEKWHALLERHPDIRTMLEELAANTRIGATEARELLGLPAETQKWRPLNAEERQPVGATGWDR